MSLFESNDVSIESLESCNAYAQSRLDDMMQVASFTKKLSQLEAEHAANLQKLLDKQPAQPAHADFFQGLLHHARDTGEGGQSGVDSIPLGGMWACILEEIRVRGRQTEKLAKQLAADVVGPLMKKHGELDASRRELMAQGQGQLKKLHDEHSGLRALRDQQPQLLKATEDAGTKVSKAQNSPWRRERELRKARERYEKASISQLDLERALHQKEQQCEEMQREVC